MSTAEDRALSAGRTLAALALGASVSACAAAPVEPKAPLKVPVVETAPASAAAAPVNAVQLTPVVAPSTPPTMAEMARRLAMVIDGVKPQVKTFPVDVAALPRATRHAPLDAKEAQKLDRTKLAEDSDLSVKPADGYARSYMLSFAFKDPSKITFGRVRIQGTYGANEGWFGEGYNGTMNTYMTCNGSNEVVPLHWESVLVESDQLKYTVTEGLLDRKDCRVLRVRQTAAVAKPLMPRGILYGFRACEGSCVENEELTVLFPRASASSAGALGGDAERSTGSFSVVSFPIQRGGGGAFLARIARRDVASWQVRTASVQAQDSSNPQLDEAVRLGNMFLNTFEVGVEVSQTHGDETPVALAHINIDPAALPAPGSAAAVVPSSSTASPAPSVGPKVLFGFSGGVLDDRR